MVIALLFLVLGYVVGAIPTGYFFCKWLFDIDITEYGSGNIGASNVARVLGKKFFIFIALIDAFKAYGLLVLGEAFLAFYAFSAWCLYVMIIGLLVGNAYSVFLNFKGGKGVATALGIMFFTLPALAVGLFILSWGVVLALTKQPFIASLCSILVVFGDLFICGQLEQVLLMGAIAIWIVLRHKPNINTSLKKFNS